MGFQPKVNFLLNHWESGKQNIALKFFLLLGLFLLAPPVSAHKTEVSGGVAGIWHVEPNHRPKAGEPTQIWVALTRRGGKILPLQEANCRMAIYREPRKAGSKPVLQPALRAMNVERYRGIPAAQVRLPSIGLYEVELSCSPKAAGKFKPFRMHYSMTVAR